MRRIDIVAVCSNTHVFISTIAKVQVLKRTLSGNLYLNCSLDKGCCCSAHLPQYSHPVPISSPRNLAHMASAPSPGLHTYTVQQDQQLSSGYGCT